MHYRTWLRQHCQLIDCYICGQRLQAAARITTDHLIPKSHIPGQARNPNGNWGLACSECNLAKGSVSFLDFAHENPQVAQGLMTQARQLELQMTHLKCPVGKIQVVVAGMRHMGQLAGLARGGWIA